MGSFVCYCYGMLVSVIPLPFYSIGMGEYEFIGGSSLHTRSTSARFLHLKLKPGPPPPGVKETEDLEPGRNLSADIRRRASVTGNEPVYRSPERSGSRGTPERFSGPRSRLVGAHSNAFHLATVSKRET